MKTSIAMAEVFYSAIKTLTRKERSELFGRISEDPKMRQDLIDLALIEESRAARGRDISLEEYKAKRNRGKI